MNAAPYAAAANYKLVSARCEGCMENVSLLTLSRTRVIVVSNGKEKFWESM